MLDFKKVMPPGLALMIVATFMAPQVEAQIFDQLFNTTRSNDMQRGVQNLRGMISNMMSVSVPAIYDMAKNGSSLGINVLSGLVKVERGQEAERSGLTGRRPLSVRVFGVPVFERGHRVRPLYEDNGGGADDEDVGAVDPSGNEPKAGDSDDESLPKDPEEMSRTSS